MAVVIKDDRRLWDEFVRGVGRFAHGPKSVVAGIQEGVVNDGVLVASYAATNEFGATITKGNHTIIIPSRPFMRLYFDNNLPRIERFSENAITQALLGRTSVPKAFSAIGLYMQSGIRKQIRKSEDYVPNSPITIKLKGSDKPLIDDAIMLNNVSFELRRS